MGNKRIRLTQNEANFLGLDPKPNEPNRHKARYSLNKQQRRKLKDYHKGIEDSCDILEVQPEHVKHLWKKTSKESVFIKNPLYKEELEKTFSELEDNALKSIDNLVKKKVKRLNPNIKSIDTEYLFDVSVFTDVHIGMNPNPDGFSLYGGKWDEVELNKRLDIFINQTLSNKKSNKLILFDLGDFMDGWDGQTVRKGHDLPQNMDNEKAFDVALNFKVRLIDELVNHYPEIEVINICDDNHSGSFSYVVNSSFKKYIEFKYENIKITNQRKFISHYTFGNKVFVATHGKDGKNLKFGFKPKLDPVQIEKIENYLFEHDLVSKSLDIYFIKGDSHQDLMDNSSSQKFRYWNFPAFSPSSNWIQTNYKKGVSGFYNINFTNETYSINPYYFKWKS